MAGSRNARGDSSKLGDARQPTVEYYGDGLTGPRVSTQELPIANVRVADVDAKMWTITLGRLDRVDQKPAVSTAGKWNLAFQSQVYNFSAAVKDDLVVPTPFPPTRENPPYGAGNMNPSFVLIGWGNNALGSSYQHRMLADWPMLGRSINIWGSYVDVWAASRFQTGTITAGELPNFCATITPGAGSNNQWLTLDQFSDTDIRFLNSATPTTGGCIVAIPDFANQVRVSIATNDLGLTTVPPGNAFWDTSTGLAYAVWWDDDKNIVDSVNLKPQDYQYLDVPARATMLGIYESTLFAAGPPKKARFTWRISP